jgi:hypothetical protein
VSRYLEDVRSEPCRDGEAFQADGTGSMKLRGALYLGYVKLVPYNETKPILVHTSVFQVSETFLNGVRKQESL